MHIAIDTAEDLRELNEINLLPTIDTLTCWEVCCYRVAEKASRIIEAEQYAEMEKERGSGGKSIGKSNPNFGKIEQGGAFSDWDNQVTTESNE